PFGNGGGGKGLSESQSPSSDLERRSDRLLRKAGIRGRGASEHGETAVFVKKVLRPLAAWRRPAKPRAALGSRQSTTARMSSSVMMRYSSPSMLTSLPA